MNKKCVLFYLLVQSVTEANMVLSSRDDLHSTRIFDGSSDVKMFMFYFENLEMHGKVDADKSIKLIEHPDGDALTFFLDKFTVDGNLTEEVMDFARIKHAFLEG